MFVRILLFAIFFPEFSFHPNFTNLFKILMTMIYIHFTGSITPNPHNKRPIQAQRLNKKILNEILLLLNAIIFNKTALGISPHP